MQRFDETLVMKTCRSDILNGVVARKDSEETKNEANDNSADNNEAI